jgi:hypothetical protein
LVAEFGYVVCPGAQSAKASWPAARIQAGQSGETAAAEAIEFFAVDAIENDPDEWVANVKLSDEMKFWSRVADESRRIASWAIQGLGIVGPARPVRDDQSD